jgi:hypothetical protein
MQLVLFLAAALLGGLATAAVADLGALRAARPTDASLVPWSAPELVPAVPAFTIDESRPLSPLTAPAFDANGDVFMVWTEQVGVLSEATLPELRLRASTRPAGGRWQPVETVSRIGLYPEVTAGASGDAIAVWEGLAGVEAAVKPAGGNWLAPQMVGIPHGDEPEEPQVASDADGQAIVVAPLQQTRGQAYAGMQAAVRPAGGAFSPPQTISRHREQALDARIAMNARGDAIAAWDEQVRGGCLVRVALRPASGAWSRPRTVPGGHEFCRGSQQVAIDQRGDAIVAWVAMRHSTMLVRAAVRDARGRWSAQPVLGEASAAAEPPGGVWLGMDTGGDAIVAWSDPAHALGGRRTIVARIRPAGHGWRPTERIAHVDHESSSPSFAMDARGDAAIVWEDQRGIEAALRPAQGTWLTPGIVSAHAAAETAFEENPVTALDARGDEVVAWQTDTNIKTAWHEAPVP